MIIIINNKIPNIIMILATLTLISYENAVKKRSMHKSPVRENHPGATNIYICKGNALRL